MHTIPLKLTHLQPKIKVACKIEQGLQAALL